MVKIQTERDCCSQFLILESQAVDYQDYYSVGQSKKLVEGVWPKDWSEFRTVDKRMCTQCLIVAW